MHTCRHIHIHIPIYIDVYIYIYSHPRCNEHGKDSFVYRAVSLEPLRELGLNPVSLEQLRELDRYRQSNDKNPQKVAETAIRESGSNNRIVVVFIQAL